MGGSKAPEDKSPQVAQIQADQAREERAAAAAEEARKADAFKTSLENAFMSANTSVNDAIRRRGVDPSRYAGTIDTRLGAIRAGVPQGDTNPGSYFANADAQIIAELEADKRRRALQDIDKFAPTGFETRRISDEFDDPYIAGINAERRAKADEYVNNLLARGVVTAAGAQGARDDLDRQAVGVTSRINELSNIMLQEGRGKALDRAGEARALADQLALESEWDPTTHNTNLNNFFTDFAKNFGNNLRAQVPEGLYDTSGLAAKAGQASFAQNTAFDPNALAGLVTDDEDEEDNKKSKTTTGTAATSPF